MRGAGVSLPLRPSQIARTSRPLPDDCVPHTERLDAVLRQIKPDVGSTRTRGEGGAVDGAELIIIVNSLSLVYDGSIGE